MTLDYDQARRVVAAIESTPEAVTLRAMAIGLYRDSPTRFVDEILDCCRDAAGFVERAHPELMPEDVRYLKVALATQVRHIATGIDPTLPPPSDGLN